MTDSITTAFSSDTFERHAETVDPNLSAHYGQLETQRASNVFKLVATDIGDPSKRIEIAFTTNEDIASTFEETGDLPGKIHGSEILPINVTAAHLFHS